ncbi:MAG TPA: hypothetical protein VFO82_08545 [Steroidobacteraceae bacterium]|nr:hypothetical protein [Steroidobacteraceae bacterium]
MKSVAIFLGKVLRAGGITAAVLVATSADAHAYVDPGTGAMILQIIGAVVAGALFYFRQLREWISAWFSRLTSRSGEQRKP